MHNATAIQAGPSVDWHSDPRHVFLYAREVMLRYGWGKTKGYQNLKNRDLVPPPVMTHPDRWRLDQLLSWEDRRIALAQTDVRGADMAPATRVLPEQLPPPKFRQRRQTSPWS